MELLGRCMMSQYQLTCDALKVDGHTSCSSTATTLLAGVGGGCHMTVM